MTLFLIPIMILLATAGVDPPRSRALWVWDTAPLLHDPDARGDFLDFCDRHRIGTVWIQIHTHGTGADRRLADPAQWQALLDAAHQRGLTVHALDGDPHYALPDQRAVVLSVVDAVIAFNASVVPDQRFDGIHLDVEPYLLPAWNDPSARDALLANYLDLNQHASARTRAAGLAYGVDVPFWWQSIDDATGDVISNTTFNGTRASAIDHLLPLIDTIGIMDYRTTAAGADGIVANALPILDRASRLGMTKVFVGIETEAVSEGVPPKVTFAGKSLDVMSAELAAAAAELAGYPNFAGIAVHRYDSFRDIEITSK